MKQSATHFIKFIEFLFEPDTLCLPGMPIFTNFLSQGHNNIDFSMTEQKIEHLAKWHCLMFLLELN